MIGLPGSGKSHHAKLLSDVHQAVIHSSDDLREELFGDVNECNKNDKLFRELHKRIKKDLSEGKSVIYDATNISYKKRRAFLQEINRYNCFKQCFLVATPYEECLEYNKKRDRKVPEHVIKKMYKSIQIPQHYEGWDKIDIIYNTDSEFDLQELFNDKTNGLNYIHQDNPHHTLTIGEHCQKVSAVCEELKDDYALTMAALYHDIGKRFTKEFKNGKGETTEIAHYFQHHLVSAYMALFYLRESYDVLDIVNYIQWHMQPFFMNQEKTVKKFIKLVGQDFYDNLMILHKADQEAH